MNPRCDRDIPQGGFSLVEMLVGLVAGALVLAGAYSLWSTHQKAGYRLEKKMDLRNEVVLSAKRIQRSITLAGLGLHGTPAIEKVDALGGDSLIIYTNKSERQAALASDIVAGATSVSVSDPAAFAGATYIAAGSDGGGEIRRIDRIEGNLILLFEPFSRTFLMSDSFAYPATRECFFTDPATNRLMRQTGSTPVPVASNIRNFQVSFRNKHGQPTDNQAEVRTVQFSFTGIFPASQGALTSMTFSSTAIPRNLL